MSLEEALRHLADTGRTTSNLLLESLLLLLLTQLLCEGLSPGTATSELTGESCKLRHLLLVEVLQGMLAGGSL